MHLTTCDARMQYSYNNNLKMNLAAIYFKGHANPIAKGMYRSLATNTCRLIVELVAKTPMATNFAIIFSTSNDFLANYLFYNGEGEKEMLRGMYLSKSWITCSYEIHCANSCVFVNVFLGFEFGGDGRDAFIQFVGNLSRTMYNKWLQMSRKQGNNLFEATCNDKICT